MKQVCENCKQVLNQCQLCNAYYEGNDIWRIQVYHKSINNGNICDLVYHASPYNPDLTINLQVCTNCWKLYKKKEGDTQIYCGGPK